MRKLLNVAQGCMSVTGDGFLCRLTQLETHDQPTKLAKAKRAKSC